MALHVSTPPNPTCSHQAKKPLLMPWGPMQERNMAFTNSLSDRIDEMRFRSAQSPQEESSFSSITSPRRGIGSQMQAPTPSANDARASLQRRFTTNTVPTLPTMSSLSSPLSPIGQQRRQAAEATDIPSATHHKIQLLEKKKLEYEYLREQRRRFQTEMELFDLQAKTHENEMLRLSNDLTRHNISGQGVPKSEPTTPPEYRENGFPSAFSRPNRYSAASMQSPSFQSLSTRPSRSGSQITSSSFNPSNFSHHIPSKSVPGSRRNSDEDDDFDYVIASMNPRSEAAPYRNSLPVTSLDLRGLNNIPDVSSVLGHVDTTKFLFDDDDKPPAKHRNTITSSDSKSYLQMDTTNDKFPILVRRDGDALLQLSASSAALDLAASQSPSPDTQPNGWNAFHRHRQGQQSLPLNTLRQSADVDDFEHVQSNGLGSQTPTKTTASNRHSMEATFSPFGESRRPGLLATPPSGSANGMPKLQSSYSTNDIPTLKSANGFGVASATVTTTPKTHAEQHLHNHNVNLGRIPPNAVNNRHSRELSGGDNRVEESKTIRPLQSVLQASAPPFGPSATSAATSSTLPGSMSSPGMQQYPSAAYYGGYGMSMMNPSLGPIQSMPSQQWAGLTQAQMQMPHLYGNLYGPYPQQIPPYGPRFPDSQARVIQQRRMQQNNDHARFDHRTLESMRGEIHSYCKDQHGCRFLQKKLEERNPEHIQMIFQETNQHVVDLMTDPFGNYLCQKLLEYANEEQRTVLINNAAPQMVTIALNQHGTRALQKMIEFISTPEQIATIIEALKDEVVRLIQDINGNHVIQKCLNHLSAQDAQFIFNAVGANCVIVGTHRHGCCVLQRCVDHASGVQKAQLVAQITNNAIDLVQDPYGNYVVQYILDLHEPAFTRPLCLSFCNKVIPLSRQKFSSNVIEKCIRVANRETQRLLIEELLRPNEMEKLLRDSFANYVVQTAMEYADPEMQARLSDAIRPVLPAIKNTPHGRRIISKLQDRDNRSSGAASAQTSPQDLTNPLANGLPLGQPPFQPPMPGQTAGNNLSGAPNGYVPSIAAPQPHRLSNPPLPSHLQAAVNQPFSPYNRVLQPNGYQYY